jgi:hypothetical protein
MFAQDARPGNADPAEARAPFPAVVWCNGRFDSKGGDTDDVQDPPALRDAPSRSRRWRPGAVDPDSPPFHRLRSSRLSLRTPAPQSGVRPSDEQ